MAIYSEEEILIVKANRLIDELEQLKKDLRTGRWAEEDYIYIDKDLDKAAAAFGVEF